MSSIRTTNAKSQGLTPVWNPPVPAKDDAPAVDGYWLVPIIADASTVAWKRPETAAEREWCEQHREEQEAIAEVRKRRAARAPAVAAPVASEVAELAPALDYIDPPAATVTNASPLPKATL